MKIGIVGCGITGCVLARKYAEKGKQVIIFDRRNHIGGNLYDYVDEYGINVHQYGPHIFHTNSEKIWNFVNKYGKWQSFSLVCGAVIDGTCVPTAFDFTTIDTFFDKEKAETIKAKILSKYKGLKTVTVLELLESDDTDIREYAEFLYEKDYKPYTAKQWGISPDKIDKSIFKRVPIRIGYKKAYFDDKYQAMPQEGYAQFIKKLLDHENISIQLNTDITSILQIKNNQILFNGYPDISMVLYTGALDELFKYKFGHLPYRSLKFEWKHEDKNSFQEMPVVAYPQANKYTRITEYKKLPNQNTTGTTYAIEYPIPVSDNSTTEPYYPVLTDDSKKIFSQYKKLAASIKNLICCGRLADFKYYNIDQAIENALNIVEKEN